MGHEHRHNLSKSSAPGPTGCRQGASWGGVSPEVLFKTHMFIGRIHFTESVNFEELYFSKSKKQSF